MLRLSFCEIDHFRALRRVRLALDATTVLVGENGCGKSSLLRALEIGLGPLAPEGDFVFRRDDFHRGPPGESTEIRLGFRFQETSSAEPQLWPILRRPEWLDEEGRIDLWLRVWARQEGDACRSSFVLQGPGGGHPDLAALAELRRVVPFIRIRHQGAGNGEESTETEMTLEQRARQRVEQSIQRSLAALIDVEVVPEEVVSQARQSVEEVLGRWDHERLEASEDPRSRVLAPLSPSGSWAQMAELMRGSGARSLALLAFVGAYLQARGPRTLEPDVQPLLTVEDPETKLHPLMLTSVWSLIQRLPTAKIVTTNSADLLAAIPLSSLRRLVRDSSGRAVVYRVPAGGMSLDELRRIAYHLRVRRGNALFMRFWLLVEGETEFWLLPEIARALGWDLRQEGIECLEFAQSGLAPLVRLAQHLGIGWHLLADGDRAGQSYYQQASGMADGVHGRVTVLREHDIEHCFWEHGYSPIFFQAAGLRPSRSRRTRPRVIIEQALRQVPKPELALLLGEAMRAPGSPGIPPVLEAMVAGALHWATHHGFPPAGRERA